MKTKRNIIYAIFAFVAGVSFVSCAKETCRDTKEERIKKVIFDSFLKPSYDMESQTRTVSDVWGTGDVINLYYSDNAFLVCQYSDNGWNIVSKGGDLPSSGVFKARYFEGATYSSSSKMDLTCQNADYMDDEVKFTIEDNSYILSGAVLTPCCSRLRFSGDEGTTFTVAGFNTPTTYSYSTNKLIGTTSSVSLTVGQDGYTPYIYGVALSDGGLTLVKDGITYARSLTPSDLPVGRSGCAKIPSLSTLGKWKTSLSVTTGDVKINSTSATFSGSVSGINNTVIVGILLSTDKTFVTDLSEMMTTSKGSFSLTKSGLTPGNTYYYKAFVKVGKEYIYGAVKSFTIEKTKNLNLTLGTHVALCENFVFTFEAGDDVKYCKKVLYYYNSKPSTTAQIMSALSQSKTYEIDAILGYGLSANTTYVLYAIGLDANGENGDILSYQFTTPASTAQPQVTISNLSKKTPESPYLSRWDYQITKNSYAYGYYIMPEFDPEAIEPEFIAWEITYMIEHGYQLDWETEDLSWYSTSKESASNFIVYGWAVDASGKFSGIVNYKAYSTISNTSASNMAAKSPEGEVYIYQHKKSDVNKIRMEYVRL